MNDIAKFKQFLRDNGAASDFHTSYCKHKLNIKPDSVDRFLRLYRNDSNNFFTRAFRWCNDTDDPFKWAELSRLWRDKLQE